MSEAHRTCKLQLIPIEEISVLNPRDRNIQVFQDIVGTIRELGLKKPITVTERENLGSGKRYLLVCGEGRVRALRELGETHVPALVIKVDDEDAYIMSLTENIARRQHSPLELLSAIERLRDAGYSKQAIGKKTGLSVQYITGIMLLLEQGEERLVVAVEAGRVPLSVAITIARASGEEEVQAALQEAYEAGTLRGANLMKARRMIQIRSSLGKSIGRRPRRQGSSVTSSSLIRSYQNEVDRQKLLVRKAEFVQQRLLFLVEALRQLLADESFSTLLRAERLETLPKQLADRVWSSGHVV